MRGDPPAHPADRVDRSLLQGAIQPAVQLPGDRPGHPGTPGSRLRELSRNRPDGSPVCYETQGNPQNWLQPYYLRKQGIQPSGEAQILENFPTSWMTDATLAEHQTYVTLT